MNLSDRPFSLSLVCSAPSRYKTNVQPFLSGLEIINRLSPIAFTWKQGGMRDIGLGAEEVERVEPLLTFRNEKGEIEGVKYNQLSAVFINAFKEQEAQIAKQNEEIKKQHALIAKQSLTIRRQEDQFIQQQIQLDRLTKLVCRSHRHAWACK